MAKQKDVKTNVMRILERYHVAYQAIFYECEQFIDGRHVADQTGVPFEQSFKTLVARGKSNAYYVFVIPIAEEVDLKAAARAVGEKSVALLPVRELFPMTGYERGGCSPLGMKKSFPTVIEEQALAYPEIYVSGGKIGCTIAVDPRQLAPLCQGSFAAITMEES